ncbi:Spy/CpxP family protein refolding chaperone [Roseomonas sp. OT10]|uniref:Spy/CpxP family protein refolding chaperone n=1 Tax=Roseomonas cutis TaxID=2897332 RepID=UPI001E5CD51D|nr:Spy/CpxP family protein refolding chaperone [Roseomonas sp. OT10]UFN50085.1 Spy/CpxP family protein refolding chaperone [Roseomonas sp. OT10]
MSLIRSAVVAAALLAFPVLSSPGAQAQPAPAQQPAPAGDEADARAILNARLAALRTVIELSPEQERLWAPLEAAIRDASRNAASRRAQRLAAAEPTTFLDVLGHIADAEVARGQDLRRVVDAATPFVASLTDAQKRRIPAFLGMTDHPGPAQPSAQLWLFEAEEC